MYASTGSQGACAHAIGGGSIYAPTWCGTGFDAFDLI
jgi:hypothetical protein